MEAKLRCVLFPGQFSSEFAIYVKSSSQREYSLFTQKTDVDYRDEPTENAPVQGWLRVDVLERERGLCIVRLPQTTLENGQYLTVLESDLELEKVPSEVVSR